MKPPPLKFMDLMRTYNAKAEADGSGFYANPSPGNIRDGLITDAIKSAGAAKKRRHFAGDRCAGLSRARTQTRSQPALHARQ